MPGRASDVKDVHLSDGEGTVEWSEVLERLERLEAAQPDGLRTYNRICEDCGEPHGNKGTRCWWCRTNRLGTSLGATCDGKGRIRLRYS